MATTSMTCGAGRRKAEIVAVWAQGRKEHTLEVTLTSLGRLTVSEHALPALERSVLLPTREVLSIFPGFISSYVDVVGVRDGIPYLFEVKDLRGFATENASRHSRELPLEIGLKARDTTAALAGLVSSGKALELPTQWVQALAGGAAVHVVAWIAEDPARPGEPAHKRAARLSERHGRAKQMLAWLTPKVLVQDPLRNINVPGVTAASLAGAGAAPRH